MGTICKDANMYRPDKYNRLVKVVQAGHYPKQGFVRMSDGSMRRVDYSCGEYHPIRTHYRANNQRPSRKAHNIAIRSKH